MFFEIFGIEINVQMIFDLITKNITIDEFKRQVILLKSTDEQQFNIANFDPNIILPNPIEISLVGKCIMVQNYVLAQCLIEEFNANVNDGTNQINNLALAISSIGELPSREFLDFLILKGAFINEIRYRYSLNINESEFLPLNVGYTQLHLACDHYNYIAVDTLYDAGIDVNIKKYSFFLLRDIHTLASLEKSKDIIEKLRSAVDECDYLKNHIKIYQRNIISAYVALKLKSELPLEIIDKVLKYSFPRLNNSFSHILIEKNKVYKIAGNVADNLILKDEKIELHAYNNLKAQILGYKGYSQEADLVVDTLRTKGLRFSKI